MKNAITEREKDITRRILSGCSIRHVADIYELSETRCSVLLHRTIERLGCEKAPIAECRAKSVMLIHQLYHGVHMT